MEVRANLETDRQPVLGRLASGEVVVDRHQSHLHADETLLAGALSRIDSRGRDFLAEQVDLGEQVGFTSCVATTEADEVVYAFRPHRAGPTRFVLNRQPEPTESVSVILKRDEEPNKMVLISAWAGGLSEPEPWDMHATPASAKFWKSHALVWGSEPIDGSKPITRG